MKDVGMASTFNVMLNHSNEAFYDVAMKKVCIQIILSLVNFGIFNFFPMYLIHIGSKLHTWKNFGDKNCWKNSLQPL